MRILHPSGKSLALRLCRTWTTCRANLRRQYKTVWAQAELIIADLFAVSGMTPDGVLSELRRYIKIKQELDINLQFDQACEIIYNQNFYQSSRTLLLLFSRQPCSVAVCKTNSVGCGIHAGNVADLGCGSGAMLCECCNRTQDGPASVLISAASSIDYARRLAVLKGVANRSHFQQGSIGDLPFRNGSVHLVIASK